MTKHLIPSGFFREWVDDSFMIKGSFQGGSCASKWCELQCWLQDLGPLLHRLLRRDVLFREFIHSYFPLYHSLSLFPFINSQNLRLFFILILFTLSLSSLRHPPSSGFHSGCDASIMVSSKRPLAAPSWCSSIIDFWSNTKVESFYGSIPWGLPFCNSGS